jgi:serine/threonine-protein kinase
MSDPTSRLATALADRYTIERELGAGGMATVYLAHDVKHDRKVAVKVLRPELAAVIGAERFLAEIKTTANLQHPHILPLHDSGEAGGTVFYVMPFIEGESLRDRLDHERQLPVDDAIRITREVADALDYAHRKGVVHRDIKPENILLHDGRAVVADFGIALAVSRSEGGSRLTETGMSLGTPHYMSPEQAMGEREITAKSDVYALGCVLYEMLTGEPPFPGPTAQAIIARVLTEEPRSLTLQRRTVPPHVEAAVLGALSKLPADRFASAAEFSAALGDAGFEPRTGTVRTAAPAAAGPPSRLTVPLAAVGVLAIVVAAWGWLRNAPPLPASWHAVSLGDTVRLVTDFPAMALSPDGRTLVFKHDRQDGLLWLKQLDRLDPVPIPGTERAQNPVFSPDGEWIAFVADGQLKKVRATGGATVTLADSAAAGFGGVAWLDDNTLVYVVPTLRTLLRVNASGGSSSPAMADQLITGGGIGHPVALPNARGVLFQNCASGCITMGIHVLDLESGIQKRLLDDVAQAWYLPNGRLLYVRRDGVALAAPFDLDALEITGEAVPVLEGVDVWPLNGFALLAWSPAGSVVYVRGTGAVPLTTVARVDRRGASVPIDSSWYGQFSAHALAPDGSRVAVGVGAGAGLNIWIKQLDDGPFTRLTFGNQDRRPAWSADGRLVAFIRDSASTSAVYVRPADGSGPERPLARIDRMVQEISWSPDGRWVVVRTDNTTAGAGDLVGVRIDGDSAVVPMVASQFSELHPSISPDGRWLAYTSNESGLNEVYIRPFPATETIRWQVSSGGGMSPVWSGTSDELFFLDGQQNLSVAQVQATAAATLNVGRATQLFDASGFEYDAFSKSFAVTPDGDAFLFIARRRTAEGDNAPRMVWVENWFTDLEERLAQ